MDWFARAFPLWITLGAGLALLHPPLFSWFVEAGLVSIGLQIVMLAMGLTLELDDFRRVTKTPFDVALGMGLQFTLMPLGGLVAATIFELSPPLRAGLLLVCACPGGTASNVIAYLAKADVALSVTMTACSTLLAALATPALTLLLVGESVEVSARSLFVETATLIILPVAAGLALRQLFPRMSAALVRVSPAVAVTFVVLIVSGILAVRRDTVFGAGLTVIFAVVVAHGLGFFVAFVLAGLVRGFGATARTISIEVGMQNSGLGAVLATRSFADPAVAVPPAISAVVHCLYGSALAAHWSRRPPLTETERATAEV
jgi:BASS family bile acid:Na+ symporter